MNMLKKPALWIPLGIIITIVAATAVYKMRQDNKPTVEESVSVVQFSDENHGLSLTYPANIEKTPLSEQDNQDKVFLRLQQATEPQYLITARAETGLRLPAQLAAVSVLDLSVNGALAALPGRYDGYKQESEGRINVGDKEAHQITFSYQGPSGASVKQRIVLIATSSDTAVYISMQSQATDFDQLDSSVFTTIQKSIMY